MSTRKRSMRKARLPRYMHLPDDEVFTIAVRNFEPICLRLRGLQRGLEEEEEEEEDGSQFEPLALGEIDMEKSAHGSECASAPQSPRSDQPSGSPSGTPKVEEDAILRAAKDVAAAANAKPPDPDPPDPDGEAGYLLCAVVEEEPPLSPELPPGEPTLCLVCTDCSDELFEATFDYTSLCTLREQHRRDAPESAASDDDLWAWPMWLVHFHGLLSTAHACDVRWPPLPPGCTMRCPREGCFASFGTEQELTNHLRFVRHRGVLLDPEVEAQRAGQHVRLTLIDSSKVYSGRSAGHGGAEVRLTIDIPRRNGVPPWQVRQWVATQVIAAPHSDRPAADEALSPSARTWAMLQRNDASSTRPWR